jgi:hypothetical protein
VREVIYLKVKVVLEYQNKYARAEALSIAKELVVDSSEACINWSVYPERATFIKPKVRSK